MNGQLSMFEPETSPDSAGAISSPASVDGPMPANLLAGLTASTSGPAPVPVNRGRPPVVALAPPIPAIFGRRGFSSYASASLQSSLANRLRARLAGRGSIVFILTWKVQTTPSGRRICALVASGRSTSGSAYGSWLSPTALSPATEDYNEAEDSCNLRKIRLLASWPTTTKEDGRSSARHGYMVTGNQGTTLLDAARMASWATPNLRDHKSEIDPEAWMREGQGQPLSRQARMVGPLSNGSVAATENTGQLNPAFSRWLIGFPEAWDEAAIRAHRAIRQRREQ